MPSIRQLVGIVLLGIALAFVIPLFGSQIFGIDNLLPNPISQKLERAENTISKSTAITNNSSGLEGNKSTMTRTPVYFISHGGPNLFEDYSHPAYARLQAIGREITQKVKPKAVIVLSAHWQGGPSTIEVNTAESEDLIYDYYGFPAHYYELKYPNKGSPELSQKVLDLLQSKGIRAKDVKRGLDHGVFAPFTVAFHPESNPLNVPVVQVSLFDTEGADEHYKLGAALSQLRDEGILIICSGMAVHNLRDFRRSIGMPGAMPYAVSFDDALKDAAEQPADSRKAAMVNLLKRPDARKAHPSFEHLLPVHVAAGAGGDDMGKQLWTLPEGSMAWAQYRFGEVHSAA